MVWLSLLIYIYRNLNRNLDRDLYRNFYLLLYNSINVYRLIYINRLIDINWLFYDFMSFLFSSNSRLFNLNVFWYFNDLLNYSLRTRYVLWDFHLHFNNLLYWNLFYKLYWFIYYLFYYHWWLYFLVFQFLQQIIHF